MKLNPKHYRLFWDAHAWLGVSTSVVLFVLFFLGAFALFHEELVPWQEPRLRDSVTVTEAEALATANRAVADAIAEKPFELHFHPPGDMAPWIALSRAFGTEEDHEHFERWVHPVTGEWFEQGSDLGVFLYLWHFLYPLPGGMRIAGIFSIFLLFLAVSGLLLQLGRIVKEFVQFRPEGAPRTRWLDVHKVTGILALPFIAMIAWTGALLCLYVWWAGLFAATVLHGDGERAQRLSGQAPITVPAGEPGPLPDFVRAGETLRTVRPTATAAAFVLEHPGDRNASITIWYKDRNDLHQWGNLRTSAAGDELLFHNAPPGPNSYTFWTDALFALHYGSYGGLGLKMIYAVLALAGSLCILAGNIIWLERRREKPVTGDVWLARSTSGVCAGLCAAVGGIFLANQILPASMGGRPDLEHYAFYAVWISSIIYAALWGSAARSARHLLFAAALMLLLTLGIDMVKSGEFHLSGDANPWVTGTSWGLTGLAAIFIAAGEVIQRNIHPPQVAVMDPVTS